jgi:hypothetical protein
MNTYRILLTSLAGVLLIAASALVAFYSPKAIILALCVFSFIMFVATNLKGLARRVFVEGMSRNRDTEAKTANLNETSGPTLGVGG